MAEGIWTMTDDGEFVLDETYAEELKKIRVKAAQAWTDTVVEHLASICPYTSDELMAALLERCQDNDSPDDIVNEFVLEALSGDL